jgi:hypothetical protein
VAGDNIAEGGVITGTDNVEEVAVEFVLVLTSDGIIGTEQEACR